MKDGQLAAVLVVPSGYGATIDSKAGPATITVYTDPSQAAAQAATFQLVGGALAAVNQAASGQPPAVTFAPQAVQTQDLSFISYLVPSILGMSLMQLGVFAAIPLVADRAEADPEAPPGDAAPALAARRQQRPDAAAHRDRPDRDHRRRRQRWSSTSRSRGAGS